MIDNNVYVFVGNREYVLKEMLRKNLNVQSVWVMENSFLHNQLKVDPFVNYTVIANKQQLLEEINKTDFDVLLSNGCKYILPISALKKNKGNAKFINIHPSKLPMLKGMDPVNGAFLFDVNSGATCHYMDDGIDTGSTIAQVEIPMTEDIDSGFLFQLSFQAEVLAFKKAYACNFLAENTVDSGDVGSYYSIDPRDMKVDLSKGFDYILRQARAFGYKSKGVSFRVGEKELKFFEAIEIKNPFVISLFDDVPEKKILFAFEDSIVFKFEGRILRFGKVTAERIQSLRGLYVESAC